MLNVHCRLVVLLCLQFYFAQLKPVAFTLAASNHRLDLNNFLLTSSSASVILVSFILPLDSYNFSQMLCCKSGFSTRLCYCCKFRCVLLKIANFRLSEAKARCSKLGVHIRRGRQSSIVALESEFFSRKTLLFELFYRRTKPN